MAAPDQRAPDQRPGQAVTGPTAQPAPVAHPGEAAAQLTGQSAQAGTATFAKAWTRAMVGTSYVPLSRAGVERFLRGLTGRLAAAMTAEPFSAAPGYLIGADLLAADFAAPEAIGRSVEIIGQQLLTDLGLTVEGEPRRRLVALVGAMTTGYARALRDRALDEQEGMRRAALFARDRAEQALRASEAQFRHQALHDPLTGLPNRVMFTERLAALFGEPQAQSRVGVCLVDLDEFKIVNDSLGHAVGDQLLTALADRLRRRLENTGALLARMGGDEFAILLGGSSSDEDATKIADMVLEAVAEPVRLDAHELTVSASIGVVELPVAGTDPGDLMRAADITLHWAKADGRGRWCGFDAKRNARQVARYTLSAAMPAALERDEFVLVYQPLVRLSDNGLKGVEALVRWRHPTLGTLSPGQFIDLAEETGLIVPLGIRLLEKACQQARRWLRICDDPPYVSVNLAVRQTHHAGLVDDVSAVLERTGLPPERLQLEITESAAADNDERTITALRALDAMGVRIAIDDFGTGYSNLAYLRTLPVHTLKLAGPFVEGLAYPIPDPADEQVLGSIISLAHGLGLTVTAEGMETAVQVDRLRALGCDTGQGWYLGRPAAPQAIDRMLIQ
ncbi:MAG: putative bifunctional diguanylate cyclase/phosphodiesterase [Mycobacteriales bacterium]